MTKKTKKTKRKISIFGVLPILLGVAVLVSVAFYAGSAMHQAKIDGRYDRIVAIYDSLKLGDEYQPVSSDVFGDKRVYEWDSSRTYSSSKEFVRGANVDKTIADLKSKIEAAGFKYFDEPYPNSWLHQYHFKSDDNEYVRLSVHSKPKWDISRDDALMKRADFSRAFYDADPNAGPSSVIIKVNLDDNNE